MKDSGFERLHPSVQYLVREVLKFSGLRPVQEAALEPILSALDVVVLAPTAGGKTEAALFPLLSRILCDHPKPVSLLYICPLRALLNNQEGRISRMADAVGLSVGKWHGDVSASLKKALVREPPDILLITPESLEVLLISPGDRGQTLLSGVQMVVVDEVHAFANDARGAHLLSVLERLQRRSGLHIQRVGLSATVGNPEKLAIWLQGSGAHALPIVVAPKGERKTPIFRFEVANGLRAVARVIAEQGAGQKRLVFVESRARAEELARALQELGVATWVHHASVGRVGREEAEFAFEQTRHATLVATSSLELGIDIGDLDHIFQLDAPATVSSLAQRLGRTGRRLGTSPRMTFVADSPEDLLLGVALASLYQDGWIENLNPSSRLWTVLVHQLFANILESGGMSRGGLWERLQWVPSFAGITNTEFYELLRHLLAEGWLDEADGILLLGQRGERVFGAKNFFQLYAVFESPEILSVWNGGTEIGTLQRWFAVQLTGRNKSFRLAGRAWEAEEIDLQRGIVRAKPAARGIVPMWTGRPGGFSRTTCERILAFLVAPTIPQGLSSEAASWLSHARAQFAGVPQIGQARPVIIESDRSVWHTFAGAKINLVLARLIEHQHGWSTSVSNLSVKVRCTRTEVFDALCKIQEDLASGEIANLADWADFDTESRAMILSVFQQCLPHRMEQEFLQNAFLDLEGAQAWAREIGREMVN